MASPLHFLQPDEVRGGQLSERHAATAALFGVLLQQGLITVVLTDELKHPLVGLGLRQLTIR